MNEPQNAAGLANPTETASYVAVTHEQNPLTGGAMPITKIIDRNVTVGELVDWYYQYNKKEFPLCDLQITQAT